MNRILQSSRGNPLTYKDGQQEVEGQWRGDLEILFFFCISSLKMEVGQMHKTLQGRGELALSCLTSSVSQICVTAFSEFDASNTF